MTKFTAIQMVRQEVEIDVDDRIYDEDSKAWKIANIILEGRLSKCIDRLYEQEYGTITIAADEINSAFSKTDKILELK